ncbi:kinase associated protein phosphatase [Actinidia rufa]|uniref:protein-serine/threonine phosphatase n=1 Tax=Actinidia rufa TaxID=165716 RepID=A0A7J0GTG4_9ERIC|nr:kinase associated protein phosphatase [Actinidia rufa]
MEKGCRCHFRNHREDPGLLETSQEVDDIERPLISEDLNFLQNQSNQFSGNYHFEGSCHSTEGHHNTPQLTQSDSLVLDVTPGPSEDIFSGQTLKKCSLVTQHAVEEQKYESDSLREFIPKENAGSILTLEVLSGPSRGLCCSVQSTNATRLPLTLGRVAPSDLILKDSEISGKHVMINWNLNKLKWEMVDMGSLNGTLLNSKAIHHTDSGSRHWGHPTELANGDIITLGTSTKVFVYQILLQEHDVLLVWDESMRIFSLWNRERLTLDPSVVRGARLSALRHAARGAMRRAHGASKWVRHNHFDEAHARLARLVQITSQTECLNPFGVGLASDPMALRRGAKKLPMEDVCYYHWPLPGADQFGIFGICDGHGGAGAATSASKKLPEMVTSILSDSFRRERVLSQCDASDVLRDAFLQTEACMNHYYEPHDSVLQIFSTID